MQAILQQILITALHICLQLPDCLRNEVCNNIGSKEDAGHPKRLMQHQRVDKLLRQIQGKDRQDTNKHTKP